MGPLTRRNFLRGLLALSATGATVGGYAFAEPFRLRVTRYDLALPRWPAGLRLRLAVIADLHVVEPWMGLSRVGQIVARTNALGADTVLLLGDYVASHRMNKIAALTPGTAHVAPDDWARELGRLEAPLGVHAVLGNHDWWDSIEVQRRRAGPTPAGEALARAGITVHENTAVRLEKAGESFWLAGLGDQWAFWPRSGERDGRGSRYLGVHDIAGTLAQVGDDEAPVILMAHEPDVFGELTLEQGRRIALQVSGHTHGGQIRLLGFAPVVPSRYGSRYVYGHIVEDDRHLVVSGGLGCSGVPIRFGSPPEIVVIDIAGAEA